MRFARMWTSSLVIAAAMFVSAVAGTASAQAKDPVIGKWNMNVAKSKFNPGPAPKTAAIVFTASGADGVKAVFDGVADTGDKVHWEYTGNHDGKDYPMTGNAEGDMISLKRVNANTVETTYKLKGKVTVVNVRTVSADGKTMTVTTKGTNAAGQKVDNNLIFEKG
jgi:hypothetical protein